MGIEDLWEALKEKQCGKTVPLSQLRNLIKVDCASRLAIDAYLIYYKYFCVEWRVSAEGNSFSTDRVISNTIRRIDDMCKKLNNNGLEHVFCLDGEKSAIKLATERRGSIKDAKISEIAKIHYSCTKWCERNPLDAATYPDILRRYDFLRDYWPNSPRWRHMETLTSPTGPRTPLEQPDTPAQAAASSDNTDSPLGQTAVAPVANRNPTDNETDTTFNISDEVSRLKKVLSKYPIIPRDMYRIIQVELQQRGHRFLSIPSIPEGEKLAATAVKIGFCQAVLSSDSDLLPMGTRMIIKEIKDDIATVFSYPETLAKLQMTHEQLMSYSIMLGNDFNEGIPGMAKVKCLQELMKPGFNIYDFDQSRGGCLNVNICLEAFTISRQECDLVEQEVTKLFCQ